MKHALSGFNEFGRLGFKAILRRYFEHLMSLTQAVTLAHQMPERTYYYDNWVMQLLYKLVFWRFYKYIDNCLMIVNILIIALPFTYDNSGQGQQLAFTSMALTTVYVVRTALMVVAVGWQTSLSEARYLLDILVSALCVVISLD